MEEEEEMTRGVSFFLFLKLNDEAGYDRFSPNKLINQISTVAAITTITTTTNNNNNNKRIN